MADITISDGTDTIRLWQTQETSNESSSDAKVNALLGDVGTKVSALNEQQILTYNGVVTGRRLSTVTSPNTFSSDTNTALAEWVARLEAFIGSGVGANHTITDNDRSITKDGALKSIGWQVQAGERYQVRWDVEFLVGDPALESDSISVDSVNPSKSHSLDSVDLQQFQSMRVDKKRQIGQRAIPFANAEENDVIAESGARKRVILVGKATGTTSSRNTFDSNIRAKVGGDTEVTFNSAFPGRSDTFVINSFEGTREAGLTRLGEYALELIEGQALSN